MVGARSPAGASITHRLPSPRRCVSLQPLAHRGLVLEQQHRHDLVDADDDDRAPLWHCASAEAARLPVFRTLAHLADNGHGDDRPDCPILDDLAEPSSRYGN